MKKKSAFTLIETIIAISVFCIGILTVLFWVSKTLRNQDYAATQIKSAFFAREWIELVFNLRDANYHKELPWNCIYQWSNSLSTEWCDENLEPWTVLKISIWDESEYIRVETEKNVNFEFTWMFDNYQIYFHTWDNDNPFIYNHYTWDNYKETGFARYLVVTWVTDEYGDTIDTSKLLKIESHVLYKKWEFTGEKVMETFIWNYEF